MLVLTRKSNEAIVIDDKIEIIINEISKDTVKIAVIAPKHIRILRKELVETVIDANKEAITQADPMQLRSLMKKK